MIAKDRGRGMGLVGFAVALVAMGMTWQAWAQQDATQTVSGASAGTHAKQGNATVPAERQGQGQCQRHQRARTEAGAGFR